MTIRNEKTCLCMACDAKIDTREAEISLVRTYPWSGRYNTAGMAILA